MASKATPRPFTDLPQAAGRWPILGHLPTFVKTLRAKPTNSSLQVYEKWHADHGPTMRVDLPGLGKPIILTNDTDVARAVMLKQKQKYPFRTSCDSWARIYEERKWPAGIPWATGDAWKTQRRVLDRTLMQGATSRKYVPEIVPVSNRLVAAIDKRLDKDTRRISQGTQLRRLFALAALETTLRVTAGISPEKFDFLLRDTLPQDALDFVASVEDMFRLTRECDNDPFAMKFRNNKYKELEKAWVTMVTYATTLVEPVLEHLDKEGKLPNDMPAEAVLPKLLKQVDAGEMTRTDAIHVIVQALAAAVDTTSQTTEFLLYNLCRNKQQQNNSDDDEGEKNASSSPTSTHHHHHHEHGNDGVYWQDQICDEYVRLVGAAAAAGPITKIITENEFESAMPTMRAVIKESMRLTPTIGAHVRRVDHPLVIMQTDDHPGYEIPAGATVLMNYAGTAWNGEVFDEPQVFDPARFLERREEKKRELQSKLNNSNSSNAAAAEPKTPKQKAEEEQGGGGGGGGGCPFSNKELRDRQAWGANLAFGLGARRCPGAGLAKTQIQMTVSAICRRYRLTYDGPPLHLVERSIFRAYEDVNEGFQFHERQQ